MRHVILINSTTDEAFSAKHMPDLGHEVKDMKVFNWKLTNWKKLDKKLTSPEFECGGHKWYVTVSNARPAPTERLSLQANIAISIRQFKRSA